MRKLKKTVTDIKTSVEKNRQAMAGYFTFVKELVKPTVTTKYLPSSGANQSSQVAYAPDVQTVPVMHFNADGEVMFGDCRLCAIEEKGLAGKVSLEHRKLL